MELYIAIPLFIVALILVIKGGDIFVDASIKIATKCRIPAIIVGATIVSIATTLPELIVAVIASSQQSFDLAIGNAIGSVICNTALVCGISLAFAPTFIKNKTNPFKSYLLIFTIFLMAIMSIGIEHGQVNGYINVFEGILLLILCVIYMYVNVIDAKKEIKERLDYEKLYNKEHNNEIKETTNQEHETTTEVKESLTKLIILFVLGAAMVALGATGLVESAKAIAYALSISETVVGLTIVAIGTSLPELVTTITSLKKKTSTLGYGNIIGANVLNMTLICGSSACISGASGLPINFWTLVVSIPVALVASFLFLIPMIKKQRTYRWQGISLLALYACYIAFIIAMTLNGIAI